jgi:hypothetical protein
MSPLALKSPKNTIGSAVLVALRIASDACAL